VAEGIETPTQAQAVTALGCELGQGFLLGRPMPPAALAATVRAQVAQRLRVAAG
jgi:EAL domain-containing protein (putative c-di-GMP-specific phosphodiesterase class I)